MGRRGNDLKRKSKLARLSPELRKELKHALRDSSDWHPQLNDQVAALTNIKTRVVRSRVYVTSASTMHSLFNILRHGHTASGGAAIVKDLGGVTDLNYLTHIVLRCYERDLPEGEGATPESLESLGCEDADRIQRLEMEKDRYRVEISMSPGVQTFKDGQHVP